MEPTTKIEVKDLIVGRVYTLRCRNLLYGVWDGEGGFIGRRFKLGYWYLFTEYHYDVSQHHGTVRHMEDTGIDVPEGMPLKVSLGSEDQVTKRDVAFDTPVAEGGRGWYFVDTGESSQDIRACSKANVELGKFLRELCQCSGCGHAVLPDATACPKCGPFEGNLGPLPVYTTEDEEL
jgi:hypothetical protein